MYDKRFIQKFFLGVLQLIILSEKLKMLSKEETFKNGISNSAHNKLLLIGAVISFSSIYQVSCFKLLLFLIKSFINIRIRTFDHFYLYIFTFCKNDS